MASIRRTQSPFHHNGGATPLCPQSPPSKLKPPPLPPPSLSAAVRRLYPRKPAYAWRLSLYGYMLFFALGFVLGLAPFRRVDDVETRDFGFDRLEGVKPDSIVIDSMKLAVEREKSGLSYEKQVIIVTPTYNRALQTYFLNRVGQVLRLVRPPLLWVVVEMNEASVETAAVLRKMGVTYRHLVCKKNSTDVKDRGVHQRNTALEYIERHRLDGIVYFADDDNVYSLELFESLRGVRRFRTWPVAMLAQSKNKAILEGPVCNGSKVIGWHTNEKSKMLRRFHVDMSGFAFNSTILWDPKRWRGPTANPIRQLDTVKEGFQETTFMEQVVEDEYQMEGSAQSCSRIMNWHLHLEASKFVYPRGWLLQKNLDVILPIVNQTPAHRKGFRH